MTRNPRLGAVRLLRALVALALLALLAAACGEDTAADDVAATDDAATEAADDGDDMEDMDEGESDHEDEGEHDDGDEGEHDDDESDHDDEGEHDDEHGDTDAPADAQTFRVESSELAFEPAELTVEAGRPIVVTHVNTGQLEHDWVLLDEDGSELAHAHAAAGEEAMTAVFTLEPGTYQAVCTIAGHADAGMVGTVTAE